MIPVDGPKADGKIVIEIPKSLDEIFGYEVFSELEVPRILGDTCQCTWYAFHIQVSE